VGRREERVVERILAEEDKQVLYRSETRRPRADSVPFPTKKESQATDACLPYSTVILSHFLQQQLLP
jgi:hypothetical protein